jgi:elongation factor G
VALAKLKETGTGDTLSDSNHPVRLPRFEFPPAAISFAITPKTRGDEEKVSNGLKRPGKRIPPWRSVSIPNQGNSFSGTSQVHVEGFSTSLKRRLESRSSCTRRRCRIGNTFVKGHCARETQEQTGGRGQFGDCWNRGRTKISGRGYEFEDAIFGGSSRATSSPRGERAYYQKAMEHGVVAGYPVVDVKVKLYDGSYHTVDSSELAFKLAGTLAWNKAHDGGECRCCWNRLST